MQTDDKNLVEWLLRDFTRLRFIERASDALGAKILLLPWSVEPPPLVGDYVGQGFVLRRARSSAASGPMAGWLLSDHENVVSASYVGALAAQGYLRRNVAKRGGRAVQAMTLSRMFRGFSRRELWLYALISVAGADHALLATRRARDEP